MVSHNNAFIGSAYIFLAVFITDVIYTLAPYPMQFLFSIDTEPWFAGWSSSNYAMNTTMVTGTYMMAGSATPVLIMGAVVALGLFLVWIMAGVKGRFSV
jgi:hypothetical protein